MSASGDRSEIDHLRAERDHFRALLVELFDAYVDACDQGSGSVPLSSPTWHMFMSTWEEADELIPRMRRELGISAGDASTGDGEAGGAGDVQSSSDPGATSPAGRSPAIDPLGPKVVDTTLEAWLAKEEAQAKRRRRNVGRTRRLFGGGS